MWNHASLRQAHNRNGTTTTIDNLTSYGGNAVGIEVKLNISSMACVTRADGVFLHNASGTFVGSFNVNISGQGHLWASGDVQADAGYYVGFNQMWMRAATPISAPSTSMGLP